MHLTFEETSQPIALGDTEQVSTKTFDELVLILGDSRKTPLDPIETTDGDKQKVKMSVFEALVKNHVDIDDWVDDYPKMTGDDFAILYNHVLDLLRKSKFTKQSAFRILRMRDARVAPPGEKAPTASRDAFAMMVSCAPALPPLLTLITTRRHPRS